MSKYIILGIPKKKLKYSSGAEVYAFFHTTTKYQDNAPYFSSLFNEHVVEKYSIEKEKVSELLKIAQGKSYSCEKRNTKYYNIIVLKLNSPKLKQLLNKGK